MGKYKVRKGDCISSIAKKNGLLWETIWNHSDNSDLKNLRKDPNALLPGDMVFVPEKEQKLESCATEQKHSFRALGIPAKMKIQMLADDKPRANNRFRIYVDKKLLCEGTTDGDGFIEEAIPPACKSAKVVVLDDQDNEDIYFLDFGSLDPIETEEGVKKRLFNLGYDVEDLGAAVTGFQQNQKLKETGTVNDETRSKLKEIFGQ